MTQSEIQHFLDCMTYEDCTVLLHGRLFWCLGLTWSSEQKECSLLVYEEDPNTNEFIQELFRYNSTSRDDCMKHFVEDKFWDGKSFYEVAVDMEWVDL